MDRHREPERELQDIGSELMKHISSDEALQLKDKLDSVSHRYQDLENKVGPSRRLGTSRFRDDSPIQRGPADAEGIPRYIENLPSRPPRPGLPVVY